MYLGASGLGLIGQLSNFINLVQGSVGNAITTGIIKFTAESHGDSERQLGVWHTGFRMALLLGIFVNFVVMAAARPISGWLFDSSEYWPVIVLTGPAIILGILGSIFQGILNNLKCIRELVLLRDLLVFQLVGDVLKMALVIKLRTRWIASKFCLHCFTQT